MTAVASPFNSIREKFHQSWRTLGNSYTNNNTLTIAQVAAYVQSKATLWAMLSASLNISPEQCQCIATRVAMDLASVQPLGVMDLPQQLHQPQPGMDVETVTKRQFLRFRQKYEVDPQGSLEFFHLTVLAFFDHDGKHALNKKELHEFFETLYYTNKSIMYGDERLPETKEVLWEQVTEQLNSKNEGVLSYEEIRTLLSGKMADRV